VRQRRDRSLRVIARGGLLLRRYGIFEIQHDRVGAAAPRLREHRLAVCRHEQEGAKEEVVMCHGLRPSTAAWRVQRRALSVATTPCASARRVENPGEYEASRRSGRRRQWPTDL